jgi:hypothetical protein
MKNNKAINPVIFFLTVLVFLALPGIHFFYRSHERSNQESSYTISLQIDENRYNQEMLGLNKKAVDKFIDEVVESEKSVNNTEKKIIFELKIGKITTDTKDIKTSTYRQDQAKSYASNWKLVKVVRSNIYYDKNNRDILIFINSEPPMNFISLRDYIEFVFGPLMNP